MLIHSVLVKIYLLIYIHFISVFCVIFCFYMWKWMMKTNSKLLWNLLLQNIIEVLEVSSRLLTVGCPASLRCWLAYSLCLLWQMGWRWCQCFPWGVSSCIPILVCGRALVRPCHGAICTFLD